MAGLDVVLCQLVPGFDEGPFASVAGDADGQFFHYGLAKLGASLGHLDPKRRGRTMCELFGTYGWREGLKLMKSFDCLVVPYGEALPSALLARLAELADSGLPVLFVDGLPARTSDQGDTTALSRLAGSSRVRAVPLQELAATLRQLDYYEIAAATLQPYLRHYHIQHDTLDVYMFFNEHPYDCVETSVRIRTAGPALQYDAFHNRVFKLNCVQDQAGLRFDVQLSPYESTLIVIGEATQAIPAGDR